MSAKLPGKGGEKSRRFWRYFTSVLIVVGVIATLVPIVMNTISRYAQRASEARWRESVEKAERSNKAIKAVSERSLTVSGDGFAPHSEVSVAFDGTPVATGRSDPQGRASIKFTVPESAGVGIHTVTMRGVNLDGTPLTLTANVTIRSTALSGGMQATSGEEIAFLVIDVIGLRTGVRNTATWSNLVKGPAYVPETAAIGQPGTALIAGHRTMYGAPFANLDRLKAGDKIKLYTKDSLYVYEVTGNLVVKPTDMESLKPGGKPHLVLSTCEPKYFSTSRLLVLADLKEAFSF
ncbi:MAG: class E sortase [Actinobacteria bacterium]|nr:class E sortase [Actinomycetota bacterium]